MPATATERPPIGSWVWGASGTKYKVDRIEDREGSVWYWVEGLDRPIALHRIQGFELDSQPEVVQGTIALEPTPEECAEPLSDDDLNTIFAILAETERSGDYRALYHLRSLTNDQRERVFMDYRCHPYIRIGYNRLPQVGDRCFLLCTPLAQIADRYRRQGNNRMAAAFDRLGSDRDKLANEYVLTKYDESKDEAWLDKLKAPVPLYALARFEAEELPL